MESQGGAGTTEGDGQSGQAASTALIEKILSEEPRWQGNQCFIMPLFNRLTYCRGVNFDSEIQIMDIHENTSITPWRRLFCCPNILLSTLL